MRKIVFHLPFLLIFGFISFGQEQAPNPASDNDVNWISTISYDIFGNTLSKGINYFNDNGQSIENQTWDILTNEIWTSKTFYDQYNRVALTTLMAPQSNFGLGSNFIRDGNGGFYNNVDYDLPTSVENPSSVSNTSTLGQYYSTANSNEFQDITNYPFTKYVYSTLNGNRILRTLGGNKMEGEWKQTYSFTMQASEELAQGRAFDDSAYRDYMVFKTITRDVHGIETVVFTDTDGRTLATARSGNEENASLEVRTMQIEIREQNYVDIHLPVGTSGISISSVPAPFGAKIMDLITEEVATQPLSSLSPGFYRIFIVHENGGSNDPVYEYDPENPVTVSYKENYYDYALNYYDDVGNLLTSTQPVSISSQSSYTYDSSGRVVASTNIDEGSSNYKYRRDGQIRFSQNSKQAASAGYDYSYTNYDALGRPIETGVAYKDAGMSIWEFTQFFQADADTEDFDAAKKEQLFTHYDYVDSSELIALNLNEEYHNPKFLSGNVAKTYSDQSTSYFSYDIYNRMVWMVQVVNGLGVKTINYEFDNSNNEIVKVIYQKHDPNELFIHRYTYNEDNTLAKVETSTNGTSFTEQVSYQYYDSKDVKRVVLGDNLQGLDYVYNIEGQLKAINHPNLNASSDPGNDTNDIFGMTIDYYNDDYLRSNNFESPYPYTSYFNGNISNIRWRTNFQTAGFNSNQVQYDYDYNKNYWLEKADFSGAGYQATDYQVSNITYDANGNIQTLKRNKNTEGGSNSMDNLEYHYDSSKPNQLKQVEDSVTEETNANDIKNQADPNNYIYNSIGELIENKEENLKYKYNTQGLVTEVLRNDAPLVKFYYNDRSHRVKKESFNTSGVTTTHYVRDLQGNPVAIYENQQVTEQPIYGTGRVGVHFRDGGTDAFEVTDHLGNVRAVVLNGETTGSIASNDFSESVGVWYANEKATYVSIEGGMLKVASKNNLGGVNGNFGLKAKETYLISMDVEKTSFKQPLEFSIWLGKKRVYSELVPKNGEFRVKFQAPADGEYRFTFRMYNEKYLKPTINEQGIATITPLVLDEDIYFYLDNFILETSSTQTMMVTGRTDYYPFGMVMPNRHIDDDYRYAYQGQEKDVETEMEAFQLRLWDSRIGRWLTVDPFSQHASPYLGMGNNPVNRVDPDGGKDKKKGFWDSVLSVTHVVLDVAGMIPGVGNIADLANAGLYALEGDTLNTALSLAAAVPGAGLAVTGGKYIYKGVKALKAARAAKATVTVIQNGSKIIKGTIDVLPLRYYDDIIKLGTKEGEGVYDLGTTLGQYVGQSKNIIKRVTNHFKNGGKLSAGELKNAVFHSMPGSTKLEREVYEHYLVVEKYGIDNLTNVVRPMGGRIAEYERLIWDVVEKYNLPL